MSRRRYDGTTGEPTRTQTPGNFDKGELQGYFASVFARSIEQDAEIRQLKEQVHELLGELDDWSRGYLSPR